MMAKLTAIQLTSVPDLQNNLNQIESELSKLTYADEHLVVLPECCLYFGGRDKDQLALAQNTERANFMQSELARLAKQYKVTLVAGSIPIVTEDNQQFTNTSLVFDTNGEIVSRYDKIHLFDVLVDKDNNSYCESRYTKAGESAICTSLGKITLGLSICYDIRFSGLYSHLASLGAQVIAVPSAFTKKTGEAHWLTLLKARAIENQVYIIAAGQQGMHANGRETFGHSVIIDPWGKVLACLSEGVGSISIEYSLADLQRVRQAMPIQAHSRFTTKLS